MWIGCSPEPMRWPKVGLIGPRASLFFSCLHISNASREDENVRFGCWAQKCHGDKMGGGSKGKNGIGGLGIGKLGTVGWQFPGGKNLCLTGSQAPVATGDTPAAAVLLDPTFNGGRHSGLPHGKVHEASTHLKGASHGTKDAAASASISLKLGVHDCPFLEMISHGRKNLGEELSKGFCIPTLHTFLDEK